jgi:hypothetical protein
MENFSVTSDRRYIGKLVAEVMANTNFRIAAGRPVLFDGKPTRNWREDESVRIVCDTDDGLQVVADLSKVDLPC